MKVQDLFEAKRKCIILSKDKTDLVDIGAQKDADFWCYDGKLKSLKGAPQEVNGDFLINRNLLTSLEHSPQKVTGAFNCDTNELTSLEGGPLRVEGIFNCSENHLTSLKGAPSYVGGNFYCLGNKIKSLAGIHKQIKVIKGFFNANGNPLESHILGLLLIDGVTEVRFHNDNYDISDILNKYLPNTRGTEAVLDCQEELIEAGYEDFAQL